MSVYDTATNSDMVCRKCGTRNSAGSNFCISCGTRLQDSDITAQTAQTAPAFEQVSENNDNAPAFASSAEKNESAPAFEAASDSAKDEKQEYVEPVNVFAEELPEWSLEPPQVVVRRH